VDIKAFLDRLYSGEPALRKKISSRVCSGYLHLNHRENRAVGDCVLSIIEMFRTRDEFYLESAKGLLLSLCALVARLNPEQPLPAAERLGEGKSVLSSALKYIHGNFMSSLSVTDMAGICGLSESHFRRLFSRSMNMSPLDYINMVRVEAACQMLCNPRASVCDVALRCGFGTPSTFDRNFHKVMGLAPVEWRKQKAKPQLLETKNIILYDGWL
jgi:transcriptional regulator GlxA family with amidase domain